MLRGPVATAVGIGVNEYEGEVGQVAHNSFVQAYVEMGLFGGSIFLGEFYLAGWGVWRTRRDDDIYDDPTLLKLQPFVFAIVVGYAAGMYSLTRNFAVPTYLVLGIAAAFIAMTYGGGVPDWFRLNRRLVQTPRDHRCARLGFPEVFHAVYGAVWWIGFKEPPHPGPSPEAGERE